MSRKSFRPPQRLPKKYSSDDYDSGSDLPQISTKKDVQQTNLFSDYSYEESSYEYSSGENWNSKTPTTVRQANVTPSPRPPNRTPARPIRPFPRSSGKNSRPLPRSTPSRSTTPQATTPTPVTPKQQPAQAAEISDGYDYEYSDVQNEEIPQPKPQMPQKNKQSPVSNEISSQPIKQTRETPQSELNNQPVEEPKQEKIDTTQQGQFENNNPPSLPVQPVPQPIIHNNNNAPQEYYGEEQTFQIVYEQKNLSNFWKRQVQMTKDDILVYICKAAKQKPYGKIHIICTKTPVELGSPNYAGMIVRHQSGSRFTLYGKGSDIGVAQPQLAGIAFVNLKQNARIRMFRVALPETNQPYTPADKNDDLSRIAFRGDQVPNVKIYSSALPVKKEDGTLSLYFGPYSIVRSTKNFLVRDENNGSNIFTIFKTFDGICTLKVRPPFTPLIGYSIAVAIATSTK